MQKNLIWFISRLSIIIFTYLIIVFGIHGLTDSYREGDSINYHIPIANAILDFNFIDPSLIQGAPFLIFQPGVNQGVLAGLMLVGLPINVFNVIGLIFLFIVCIYVARRFDLERNLSIVFAGSVVTLHVMLRWINTQIIDIWMLIWFLLILGLLQKIENNPKYYFILGLTSGLLIGSKYTGPFFLLIIFIFYISKLISNLNIKNLVAFIIPFTVIGVSWYVRNYYFAGNPLYPEPFLFFKGDESFGILETRVWETTILRGYIGINFFVDALISEFTLWTIAIFAPFLLFIKEIRRNKPLKTLILIGSLNLILFAFLPSDRFYNIVVSVFRYSLPAFIALILALFLAAQQYKKEMHIALFAMTNFLFLSQIQYRPKLVIIMLPIIFILFFPEETKRFVRGIIPSRVK